MRRRLLLAAAAAAAAAFAASPPVRVCAQGLHRHGGGHARGPNGGQIQELGGTHAELLARDGEIRLWVLDAQDRPASVRGAAGSAIVLAEGKQQTVRLEPGPGDAYLVGRGEFRAANGLRVVASVTMPGQQQRQARFAPVD
jgi:hypothetical protein